MSRYKYFNRATHRFSMFPHTRRGWCFYATSVYMTAALLWFFASPAHSLAGLTSAQCTSLLTEFHKTFVQDGDGYPTINSCDTKIVRLMWEQQINRVYSTDGVSFNTYEHLRALPDDLFARLIVNAAAGSLLDSTQTSSDDAVLRIRVNPQGHFQRYILNDNNRVVALQTMLVLSILTLAVTWWQLAMKGTDVEKSV